MLVHLMTHSMSLEDRIIREYPEDISIYRCLRIKHDECTIYLFFNLNKQILDEFLKKVKDDYTIIDPLNSNIIKLR